MTRCTLTFHARYLNHVPCMSFQFVREVTRLAGNDDSFFPKAVEAVSNSLEQLQAKLLSPLGKTIYMDSLCFGTD